MCVCVCVRQLAVVNATIFISILDASDFYPVIIVLTVSTKTCISGCLILKAVCHQSAVVEHAPVDGPRGCENRSGRAEPGLVPQAPELQPWNLQGPELI